MEPILPDNGTVVPAVAAPVSSASLQPSPSESKSILFGIPSPSVSTSVQVNPVALLAINFTSVNNLVVAPAHDKTK